MSVKPGSAPSHSQKLLVRRKLYISHSVFKQSAGIARVSAHLPRHKMKENGQGGGRPKEGAQELEVLLISAFLQAG